MTAMRRSLGSVLEALAPYVTLGRIGVPEPGPSQVLIKVKLASINPSDVMFVKGMYGQPRQKGQPAGFEGVGEVVAAGSDAVKGLVGLRVAFATGLSGWGTWAEYAVAEAAGCIPLIDGVRDEDGAADRQPADRARHVRLVSRRAKRRSSSPLAQPALQADDGRRARGGVPHDCDRAARDHIALGKAGAAIVLNARRRISRSGWPRCVARRTSIFLDAVTDHWQRRSSTPCEARALDIYGRLDQAMTRSWSPAR